MPMKIKRWNSFSPTKSSQTRESSATSNSTAKRLARLVALSWSTQERGFAGLFHPSTPSSLSVMAATVATMASGA